MRSLSRGVILFGVGAALCAGVVYTADRSGGLLSGKADNGRNRTTSLSQSDLVRFERQPQEVTRQDMIAYASGFNEFASYASQGINEARRLMHQGQVEEALSVLNRVTQFKGVDDATMATAYLAIADAYLGMPGQAPLKGVHYLEQGLRLLDRGSLQFEERLTQAVGVLNQFGLQSDASRLQGRLTATSVGQISSGEMTIAGLRGQQNGLRTPGADDSCTGATAIVVEPTPTLYSEAGMLIAPLEADYRSFSLTAATTMRFQTFGAGADPILHLYNTCVAGPGTPAPAGFIAVDDDSGEGFNSLLNVSCLDAGDYWLRVGGFADGGSGVPFTLEVETIETCFVVAADAFEPDDETSLATQVGCNPLECPGAGGDTGGGDDDEGSGNGGWGWHWWWWGGNDDEDDEDGGVEPCAEPSTQTHTLTEADIDFVTFNVGTTGRVVVETSGTVNTPNADTLIVLSTSVGQLFAANDNKSFFDAGSKIDLCLPPGEYNVGVIPGLAATLFEFEYTITVQHTDCDCKFEVEPNAQCGMATPISYPDSISGVYESGGFNLGDNDWYTFTLTEASTNVAIETGAGPNPLTGDSVIELYIECPDSIDSFVAGDDDGGPGLYSRLCLEGLPPATYYLRVTGFGGSFPYDLTLSECVPPTPESEPNSSCAAADGPAVIPETFSGVISPAGTDRDYYAVSLASPEFIIFETLGNDDTVLRLYPDGPNCGSDAGLIGCNDDKTASDFMSFLPCCLAAGDYRVSVGDWQNLAIGSAYELAVTSEGACVPSGSCPIELGGFSTCLVLP